MATPIYILSLLSSPNSRNTATETTRLQSLKYLLSALYRKVCRCLVCIKTYLQANPGDYSTFAQTALDLQAQSYGAGSGAQEQSPDPGGQGSEMNARPRCVAATQRWWFTEPLSLGFFQLSNGRTHITQDAKAIWVTVEHSLKEKGLL